MHQRNIIFLAILVLYAFIFVIYVLVEKIIPALIEVHSFVSVYCWKTASMQTKAAAK